VDTPSARAAAVSYIASEVLRYGLVFLHQHANDAQIVEAVTDLLENVPRLIYDPSNPVARQSASQDVRKLAERFPRSGFVARSRALDVSLGSGAPSLARIN
jgi:hypothetical protein